MNPILEKIKAGISEKVSAENQPAFRRAVLAGKKMMFDKASHANMELVKNPQSRKDPVTTVSQGVAGLAFRLYMIANKTMKPEVLIMSAMVLMCEAFDFMERAFGIAVDNDLVAATTKKLGELLYKKLGITPEMMNDAIAKGHGEIQAYQAQQPPV